MILRNITDVLIRSVSGGTNTVDNKYEPEYVEALIPSLRERAIRIEYFGDRSRKGSLRLDYSLFQKGVFQRDAQQNKDADYVTFTIPRAISLGDSKDGFVYVGQKNNSVSFTKLFNREDVSNMKARGMLQGGQIAFVHEGDKGEFYGNNSLTEVEVRGIFFDPTEVPDFRVEVDDYPITASLLTLMTELFKIEQNVNIQKPADNILDNADTTSRVAISNNLKQ